MAYELVFTLEADEVLRHLEDDASATSVLAALRRALGRLETDPFDRRLGTRMFRSAGYEHIRATPVRLGNWWVLWAMGPEGGTLFIVHVGEIEL
jgi:hypothetical protein